MSRQPQPTTTLSSPSSPVRIACHPRELQKQKVKTSQTQLSTHHRTLSQHQVCAGDLLQAHTLPGAYIPITTLVASLVHLLSPTATFYLLYLLLLGFLVHTQPGGDSIHHSIQVQGPGHSLISSPPSPGPTVHLQSLQVNLLVNLRPHPLSL